jgi:hypothetical protein
MTKDSPDFQVTVVVNTVPTSDNPDWQLTAVGPGGSAVIGPNPATSVTGPDSYGSPAVVGTSLAYARQDHDHGLPAAGGGGGLLACVQYAPAVFQSYATFTDIPAVVDSTDLTIAFTAPASGKVLIRLTAVAQVLDSTGQTGYWCLMDHTTGAQVGTSVLVETVTSGTTAAADVAWPFSIPILVTGLTPGSAYQYDWGFFEGSHGPGGFHMYVQGGTGVLPTSYAGPAMMEVWAAV